MIKDEALDEIRAVRKQISSLYGNEITPFLNHYRALDKKYSHRLQSNAKKKPDIISQYSVDRDLTVAAN